MIDIHSHVLPGIDDGSVDMEMSLDMLAMAAESGVDTLVATPHCNIPGEYENYLLVSSNKYKHFYPFSSHSNSNFCMNL